MTALPEPARGMRANILRARMRATVPQARVRANILPTEAVRPVGQAARWRRAAGRGLAPCLTPCLAIPLLAILLLTGAALAQDRPAAGGPRTAPDALLTGADLRRVGALGWIAPGFVLPPQGAGTGSGQGTGAGSGTGTGSGTGALPPVDPAAQGPVAGLVRRLVARGLGAGFAGVVYDNRDRGHSTLPKTDFPALSHLVYAPELIEAGLDYGLGGGILLPVITLGNSSTAVTGGGQPRSLPRLAMTLPEAAARVARGYAANQIYLYPEHRDHDAVDLFPANWPYTVISQGSSGSDQPFLHALALTLAALPPDTRATMAQAGLVAPTLQMILRRSQTGVLSRAEYRSPAAHPTVFDADRLSPGRMVSLAASLRPGDIPPLVRLRVAAEGFAAQAGLAGLSERLFDTPSAIARVWRGPAYAQEMTVSAAETRDPNGRPLEFVWVLLRGDPARVRITPLDPGGHSARLQINWHDPAPAVPARPRAADAPPQSTRVDVGVFAFNGVQDSAPAFVSVSFPDHETRVYAPGPDGALQLQSVDYDAAGRGVAYDPALHWSAPWRDSRSATGGWTRQPAGGGAPRPVTLDAALRPLSGPYGIGGSAGLPFLQLPD